MRGIRALWLMLMLLTADGVSAQLVEKVLRAIEGDSLAPVTTIKADSDSAVSLSAIKQELEAARLNEANLRMEMEQLRLASYAADSVKHLQQKQRIDSLRKVTPGRSGGGRGRYAVLSLCQAWRPYSPATCRDGCRCYIGIGQTL